MCLRCNRWMLSDAPQELFRSRKTKRKLRKVFLQLTTRSVESREQSTLHCRDAAERALTLGLTMSKTSSWESITAIISHHFL